MPITLEKALDIFIMGQELKDNTSQTIKFYKITLSYLLDFLGKDKLIVDITIQDLNKYKLSYNNKYKMSNHPLRPTEDKPITKTTIQSYIRSARAFLGYLYEEGYLQTDFRKHFKLPKAPKKAIEILSEEEIRIVLSMFNEKTELGIRNKCIIALMVDSGLRRGEIVELKLDNVHLHQNLIKVNGKGDKERIVPISTYTKKLLFNYITSFRSFPEYQSDSFFLSKNRRGITKGAIKQLFTRIKQKTGIKRIKPHLLRHTFATRYIMNGGDMFTLQQILGHSDLGMVRKYVHLAGTYSVNVHKNRSTLDKMCRKNIL